MSEISETKRPYTSRKEVPRPKKHVKMTSLRIQILKLLVRYKYLPTKYVAALTETDISTCQETLREMRRARYIECEESQWRHDKVLGRDLSYSLATKGRDELRERGMECDLPLADGGYPHQLMIDEITASFELGQKETGLRIETWRDMFAGDVLPEATRKKPKPFLIPVLLAADDPRDKPQLTHVKADGEPFRVVRESDARSFFCPGIEADQGTEPIDAVDFERSSWRRKFTLWLDVIDNETYVKQFGRKSFFLPVITGSQERVNSIIELLLRMTDGEGAPNFLFKTHTTFYSKEKPLPPSGRMLTEDWQRARYPHFNFKTS